LKRGPAWKTEEDIRQHLVRQLELSGHNARDVHGRNGATDHEGELPNPVALQVLGRERHVSRGEINGPTLRRIKPACDPSGS
jgi:hypothetical protein